MKAAKKLLTAVMSVVLSFSMLACADMGEGEHETAFHDYFSGVYLFSSTGRYEKRSIADFNASIETGAEEMKQVVEPSKYAYIAFRVAKGYTLEVEEFACHAKTDGAEETVHFDFYISQFLPTQMNTEEGTTPMPDPDDEEAWDSSTENEESSESMDSSSLESSEEREEIPENSAMDEQNKFSSLSMKLTGTWDSALLSFGTPQRVNPYEFIILRARNNCILNWEELGLLEPNPVAFTVNYLMFRFTKVEKR